jgi:hypothetical protein
MTTNAIRWRTERKRRALLLRAATAACVLLVGCSDDDDGGDAAPSATTDGTSSSTTSPTSTSTEGDATSVDEEASGDFCELNEEIARLFGELAQTGSEETWAEIEDVVAQMPGASPPELEADVAVAVGYYPTARAELEAADWDVTVLETLALEPDEAQAEDNITAYLNANC